MFGAYKIHSDFVLQILAPYFILLILQLTVLLFGTDGSVFFVFGTIFYISFYQFLYGKLIIKKIIFCLLIMIIVCILMLQHIVIHSDTFSVDLVAGVFIAIINMAFVQNVVQAQKKITYQTLNVLFALNFASLLFLSVTEKITINIGSICIGILILSWSGIKYHHRLLLLIIASILLKSLLLFIGVAYFVYLITRGSKFYYVLLTLFVCVVIYSYTYIVSLFIGDFAFVMKFYEFSDSKILNIINMLSKGRIARIADIDYFVLGGVRSDINTEIDLEYLFRSFGLFAIPLFFILTRWLMLRLPVEKNVPTYLLVFLMFYSTGRGIVDPFVISLFLLVTMARNKVVNEKTL